METRVFTLEEAKEKFDISNSDEFDGCSPNIIGTVTIEVKGSMIVKWFFNPLHKYK